MSLKQTNNAENNLIVGNIQVLGKIGGGTVREIKTTVSAMAAASAIQSSRQKDYWSDLASDNVITTIEKKILLREWKTIESTYTSVLQTVKNNGISESQALVADYKSGYNDLYSYLFSTLKLFDDMNSNTQLADRSSFNALYTNFYADQYAVQEYVNGVYVESVSDQHIGVFLNVANESLTIPVSASGIPLTGVLPLTIACPLYAGSRQITTGVTYAVTTSASGISIGRTTGVITVASDASLVDHTLITVTATMGVNQYSKDVYITKSYPGNDAWRYSLIPSVSFIKLSVDQKLDPVKLTASVQYTSGNSIIQKEVAYGTIKYATDRSDTPVAYPADGITLTSDISWVDLFLYDPDDSTHIMDHQRVPVVADGSVSQVALCPAAITYPCTSSGKITQDITSTLEVRASDSAGELTVSIGTIPATPGFSVSVYGNRIVVTAKQGTDMADAGTIEIPVIVDNWVEISVYGNGDAAYGDGDTVYGNVVNSATASVWPLFFTYSKAKAGTPATFRTLSSMTETGNYINEMGLCNGIIYRWDGNEWVKVADITPRSRGSLATDADMSSMASVANIGDWCLYTGSTGTYKTGTIYRWNGSQWASVDVSNADNSYMVNALLPNEFELCQSLTGTEQTTYKNNIVALSAIIKTLFVDTEFVDQLTSNTAFIENLATKIITLKNTGCIQTENYSTTADSGFKLNAADGSANFNNLNVYGSMTFYSKINELYGKSKLQLPNGRPTIAAGEQSKGLIWIE